MSVTTLDELFLRQVDAWVLQALKDRPSSFDEFIKMLPGVYPTDALYSLRRIQHTQHGVTKLLKRFRSQVSQNWCEVACSGCHHMKVVPLEHPLDFEWRFCKSALARISAKLQQLSKKHYPVVLCLGCPSVFEAGIHAAPNSRYVLWDKNARNTGQLAETDLLANVDCSQRQLPTIAADVVVIDPPWYNDYYKVFVWAALQNMVIGGHIVLSFPPVGTRPSARADFDSFLVWCQSAGLEMDENTPRALPYCSPLFELNALKVAGIRTISLDWRAGNMVVLTYRRKMPIQRPTLPPVQQQWLEFRFGPTRIKLSKSPHNAQEPKLLPVWKTSVLPSVSSKFPSRGNANFVTSGNRFLQTSNPCKVIELCSMVSASIGNSDISSARVAKGEAIQRTLLRQVQGILVQEAREAKQYFALSNECR